MFEQVSVLVNDLDFPADLLVLDLAVSILGVA